MPFLHIFYALLVVVVWGANFVASKFALEHFPPILATALRFALLCPLILPFVRRPNKHELKFLLGLSVLGVLHFTLPQASLAAGLDIATCAILNQLCVPFACLLGVFFHGDHLGKWRLLGLLLAFAGMVVVFGSPHMENSWIGSAYAIAAAFFFAIYSVLMKRHPEVTAMQILGYVCLFGFPQVLLLSWLLESPNLQLLQTASMKAWGGMAYTVVLSSVVGHGLWNYLVKKHPVSHVAPFSLLVPIAGVAFGQIFYQEALTYELLFGGLMTLLGVGIIVIRRPKLVEKSEGI
jgi:O-acetylserine/cysteine efflux transporter